MREGPALIADILRGLSDPVAAVELELPAAGIERSTASPRCARARPRCGSRGTSPRSRPCSSRRCGARSRSGRVGAFAGTAERLAADLRGHPVPGAPAARRASALGRRRRPAQRPPRRRRAARLARPPARRARPQRAAVLPERLRHRGAGTGQRGLRARCRRSDAGARSAASSGARSGRRTERSGSAATSSGCSRRGRHRPARCRSPSTSASLVDRSQVAEGPRIAITAGVASCPEHGTGAEALLGAADEATWAAKAAGSSVVVGGA